MRLLLLKLALTIPVAYAFVFPLLHPGGPSGGIFRDLALVGPAGALLVILLFFGAVFFYCRDLYRALSLVRPEARTASPRSVWLMFLLPYNFVEDFFIVANVATSLRREAAQNAALQSFRSFGLLSGLGWCSAQIVSLLPNDVGSLAGVMALPLWLHHWWLIRRINGTLTRAQEHAGAGYLPTAHPQESPLR